MAQQTKAERSEAAKKAAATRQRNRAGEAGQDARRSAKQAIVAGEKAAKSLGRALKSAGKAAAARSR